MRSVKSDMWVLGGNNMADIIIGEKVINKAKETGVIISFEKDYITVDFNTRVATFQCNAFEQGFLKYENIDLWCF